MSQSLTLTELLNIHGAAKRCLEDNYRVDHKAASLLGVTPQIFRDFTASARASLNTVEPFSSYLWYLESARDQVRRVDNQGNKTVTQPECLATLMCAGVLLKEAQPPKVEDLGEEGPTAP